MNDNMEEYKKMVIQDMSNKALARNRGVPMTGTWSMIPLSEFSKDELILIICELAHEMEMQRKDAQDRITNLLFGRKK